MKDTEAAILAAAEQEFMLKGFGGARTTSIAQRAGVTHAMLHYYFRTKESLFHKVFNAKVEELLSQVLLFNDVDAASGSFADEICRLLERHFDMLVRNPMLPSFVLSESRNNPELFSPIFANILTALAGILPRLQQSLSSAVAAGEVAPLSLPDLLVDIASLNLTSVSYADVFCRLYGCDKKEYLAKRKLENVNTIRKRLMS